MFIYKDNYWNVDLHMEVVPAYFSFNECKNGNSYRFTLSGDPLDDCLHEKEIREWLSLTEEEVLEAIWQWNLGNDEVEELIKVKLKYYPTTA